MFGQHYGAPLGFGAHSDQERIIESELYRFFRAYYETVERLAGADGTVL